MHAETVVVPDLHMAGMVGMIGMVGMVGMAGML